ncbi:MAG: UDP-glucose/GDP-mannose dehydrogenase family protein [Anaerolineales bacterium]|nr:UDP-glucose/GDP-mannose dehydrogenase family protein [Anaerolineales bacterium]
MKSVQHVPEKVAVIGLGKLGSPMAAAVAARGVAVVGADLDSTKVEKINRGEPPVNETDLAEYLRRGKERLSATTDLEAAAAESEIVFIIVPTPSEPKGGFSIRHVLSACESIGGGLKKREDFPVVVVTATVMPGSTGGPIRECLEKHSGRKAGKDFGLCYSPEFIALGSVIRDFLNPDFILCGESDPRSGEILDAFYQKVCENGPHVAHMNFANAELSKLAVNTYVTTKITYANMLARICERLPGGDVDTVTAAIARDTRIGIKYLKGANGYGGPCFPRDNKAMAALARGLGLQAALAETTDAQNRAEVRRLADLVKRYIQPGAKVGILGLSYKPDTDVIEESQGVLLAQQLLEEDLEMLVYDPMAMDAARVVLGDRPRYCGSAEDCVRQSDVVVITIPWKEFSGIPEGAFSGKRTVLIDCWRIAPTAWRAKTEYVPVGVNLPGEQEAPRPT